MLTRAWDAFATAASSPRTTAITLRDRVTQAEQVASGPRVGGPGAWYAARQRTHLQTMPVSSRIVSGHPWRDRVGQRRGLPASRANRDRDDHRVHRAAGPAGPDGDLGRPEDLDLPQDPARPSTRVAGTTRRQLESYFVDEANVCFAIYRQWIPDVLQRVPAETTASTPAIMAARNEQAVAVARLPDGSPWQPRRQWDRLPDRDPGRHGGHVPRAGGRGEGAAGRRQGDVAPVPRPRRGPRLRR